MFKAKCVKNIAMPGETEEVAMVLMGKAHRGTQSEASTWDAQLGALFMAPISANNGYALFKSVFSKAISFHNA